MPSARIAPESGRNTPSAKRPHASPGALPSHRQGPTSTDLDAPSLRGHQRRAVGPCWARVRSPTRRPRRRPRQRADVGRGCSEQNPATRIIKRVLTASGTYSPCGRNTRGQPNAPPRLRRSKSSSTVPRTRHTIRPAAPSLRLLESDAASGTAAQQRSAGCRMCRPQRDRSQVALGCNTVHVVATWRMWLQHSVLRCCVTLVCCAEADVPEGSSGDTDVGLGMESVAVQMWDGLD